MARKLTLTGAQLLSPARAAQPGCQWIYGSRRGWGVDRLFDLGVGSIMADGLQKGIGSAAFEIRWKV
ncbi:hypothetical protein APS14_19720 [Pseudomonas thivervalensis]|nr:hypothetical protein APS14_19720 [Pseudomonas thivervalensis]